jgi:hypothetical protein
MWPAAANPKRGGGYGAFYWPLVVVGLFTVLSDLLRSGTLARTQEGTRELAAFAIASSLVAVLQSTLILAPQLPNVFARSPEGARVCRRFLMLVCAALALPIVLLGFLPPGQALLARIYKVDASTLSDVILYLQLSAPLLLLVGLNAYWTGLLLQCGRTAYITLINMVQFGAVALTLFLGEHWGLRPIVYAALSQTVPMALSALLGMGIVGLKYRLPDTPSHRRHSYADLFSFFWPAALGTLLFVLNRPVIFSFLSSAAAAVAAVAALRVALDVCMVFFNAMNQLRTVYVTFGEDDLAGVRRFLLQVSALLAAAMALLVFTPLHELVFGGLLGLRDPVKSMAIQSFGVLCLIPLVIAVRSEFHGRALLARSTRGMGLASLISLASVVLLCWILQATGVLNHITAAAALVFGFVIEIVAIALASRKRELP